MYRYRFIAWSLLLASISSPCLAQSARLEAEQIYAGDVTTLYIEYENKIPSLYALDTSELEKNFQVLDIQSRTSRVLAAEQFTNRMQWEIQLLPRRSGRLLIPSLNLGGRLTPERTLEVIPLSASEQVARQIRVEIEALPVEPYVGQQVNLTLRVLANVPLQDIKWMEPRIETADVVRGIAESNTRLTRDGQSFDVTERVMAVFARSPGSVTISPARFEATLYGVGADESTAGLQRKRRILRASETLRVKVRDVPAEYRGRYWLPARELTLAQRWEEKSDQLRVGDSLGRTLTIVARGLPADALPVDLLVAQADGFRVHADQPEFSARTDGRDLVGRIEQSFAIILTRAGEVVIPELRLQWWDVDAGRPREAVLGATTLRVGSAIVPPGTTEFSPGASVARLFQWLVLRLLPHDVSPLWLLLPTLLLGAAITAGWLGGGVIRTRLQAALRRRRARQRLRQACRANDPQAARRALLDWAVLRWPGASISALGQLERHLDSAALDLALVDLDRALFAPPPQAWQGRFLWQAFSAVERAPRPVASRQLPPLYPQRFAPPGD